MMEYSVFLFCAYGAAVVATIAGFGSSTVLIPVAMFFMDFKAAVFLVACFHLFNNVFKVRLFFKKIDFRLFWIFGIPSILFAFLGAQCIAALPVTVLKKAVAVFLILFTATSLFRPEVKIGPRPVNAVIGGGLSGFLAGLIGMGGAIRSMFLLAFDLPKEVYVATGAMIAFVVDLTRIPTYLWTGIVHDQAFYYVLPLMVGVAYLGVKTGKALLGKLAQKTFRKLVLGTLFLISIKLLFS